MASARPLAVGGAVPTEATSQGSLNETTPASQRSPKGNSPKTDGAVRIESGAYAPAEYKTGKSGKLTRRDR